MPCEWKPDLDFDHLNEHHENVRLVFDEAKTRLQGTVDSYNIILAKANGLLGFIVALSTGLMAFVLSNHVSLFVGILLALYIGFAIVAGYNALRVLWKRDVYVDGFMPDRLFKKEWIVQEPTKLQAQLIVLYAEKIAFNQGLVQKLTWNLKLGTVFFLLGSGIFSFGYLSAASGLSSVLIWAAVAIHL